MNRATIRALAALNREFYEDAAAEFSATRRHPWGGWYQIAAALRPDARRDAPLRVLDVGCGNGRFGRFLARAPGAPLRYVGVDASGALLEEARASLEGVVELELHPRDVSEAAWSTVLGAARFDLVAVFGLLHHIPGRATRRALVAELGARVSEAGCCALAIWPFAAFERFRARILPWTEVHRLGSAAAARIDPDDLEPGDHLLRWGEDGARARYCHFVDAAEVREIIAASRLACAARFDADGRGGDRNRYYLLRRP